MTPAQAKTHYTKNIAQAKMHYTINLIQQKFNRHPKMLTVLA